MRARGFTLLEAVVVSALVGVLGLAIASILRAAHDADRALRGRSERRATERAALQAIARDLRALVPPGGVYAAGLVGTQGEGATGGEDLAGTGNAKTPLPSMLKSGEEAPPVTARDTLTLAVLPPAGRFGSTAALGTGAIEEVTWAIDDDPSTPERGLVRLPTRIREPLTGSEPEPAEEIAPEVVGLRCRYWDGTTWADSFDSSASDTLPRAVEVSLAVRDPDGSIHRLATVIAPLTGRPSELVQPTGGTQ